MTIDQDLIAGGDGDIPRPGLAGDVEATHPPARPRRGLERDPPAAAERYVAVGKEEVSPVRMILREDAALRNKDVLHQRSIRFGDPHVALIGRLVTASSKTWIEPPA